MGPESISTDRRDTVEQPQVFVIQETNYHVEGETAEGSYSARTHIGDKIGKKQNEDAFLMIPQEGLFVVADGVGGEKGGGEASSMAVSVIAELCLAKKLDFSKTGIILETILKKYKGKITEDCSLEKMATTLAGFHIEGNELRAIHIGDSRVYVFDKNGRVKFISQDDSEVQQYINEMAKKSKSNEVIDKVNEFEANFFRKNIISECVSTDRNPSESIHNGLVEIETPEQITNEGRILVNENTKIVEIVTLVSGDIVLACSDGLNDGLSQAEIEIFVGRYSDDLRELGEVLEEMNRAKDDITFTLYKHGK